MRVFWKDGFYLSAVHSIPDGAVEITKDQHLDLLEKQSQGLKIITGVDGIPTAIKVIITPSVDEVKKSVKRQRNEKIADTDYLLMPDYPLTDKQKEQITAYRKALRDLPEVKGFPWIDEEVPWPELPFWVSTISSSEPSGEEPTLDEPIEEPTVEEPVQQEPSQPDTGEALPPSIEESIEEPSQSGISEPIHPMFFNDSGELDTEEPINTQPSPTTNEQTEVDNE